MKTLITITAIASVVAYIAPSVSATQSTLEVLTQHNTQVEFFLAGVKR